MWKSKFQEGITVTSQKDMEYVTHKTKRNYKQL
jgi:hypothetical protein